MPYTDGPSSNLLMRIFSRSEEQGNRKTFRFLAERGYAEPRPGRGESRIPNEWELTEEGRRLARDLRDFGKAYGPDEFTTQRRSFEASLSPSGETGTPAQSASEHEVPAELTFA